MIEDKKKNAKRLERRTFSLKPNHPDCQRQGDEEETEIEMRRSQINKKRVTNNERDRERDGERERERETIRKREGWREKGRERERQRKTDRDRKRERER